MLTYLEHYQSHRQSCRFKSSSCILRCWSQTGATLGKQDITRVHQQDEDETSTFPSTFTEMESRSVIQIPELLTKMYKWRWKPRMQTHLLKPTHICGCCRQHLDVELQESHEVQQGQVQDAAPGWGQALVLIQAGCDGTESSPDEDMGGLVGEKNLHGPDMWDHGPESQSDPRLDPKQHGSSGERWFSPSALLWRGSTWCCIPVLGSQYKRDREPVQRRATEIFRGWKTSAMKKGWRSCSGWGRGERPYWWDLAAAFPNCKAVQHNRNGGPKCGIRQLIFWLRKWWNEFSPKHSSPILWAEHLQIQAGFSWMQKGQLWLGGFFRVESNWTL